MAIDRHYQKGRGDLPPFPPQSGTVIVCGSAWTLRNDFNRARRLFPTAKVIAVNYAAGLVPADFLFSLHPIKMGKWADMQREMNDDFTTHSSGDLGRLNKLGKPRPDWQRHVDYWWPEARTPGSSGWGARRLAKLMGFDKVVLCGVPVSKGGYALRAVTRDWGRDGNVRAYQKAIELDVEYHEGVISMSGFTMEKFGGEPNRDGHDVEDSEAGEV